MKRNVIIVTLLFALVFFLTGCGSSYEEGGKEWKDNFIEGYNSWLQSFSRFSLTGDGTLKGKKDKGVDEYTGTYSAEYESFNGKEFLFGGTSLERKDGSDLEVVYSIKITSGSATLYWLTSGEEYTISDKDGDGTYNLTLRSGDNYIILKGENYSGSLSLTVKDTED